MLYNFAGASVCRCEYSSPLRTFVAPRASSIAAGRLANMLRSLRLVQTRGLRPLSTANFPTYRSLAEATAEDMKLSVKQFRVVSPPEQTASRALAIFSGLKDVNLGCQVDLYEHGLQTATRAYEDGADVEQVVVALLHDIGELLSPVAHGEVAAGLLRPYISAENYWILMHHEVFQAYYYGDAAGVDKDLREQFRGEEYFDACEYFCGKWDQTSFDPDFESRPLDFFEPMVRDVVSRTPYWDAKHMSDPLNRAKRGILGAYPGANAQRCST